MADEEKQLLMDYKQVFDSPGGQRVLADLASKFDPLSVRVDADRPTQTYYYLGERAVVCYVRSQLARSPDEEKQDVAIMDEEEQ